MLGKKSLHVSCSRISHHVRVIPSGRRVSPILEVQLRPKILLLGFLYASKGIQKVGSVGYGIKSVENELKQILQARSKT